MAAMDEPRARKGRPPRAVRRVRVSFRVTQEQRADLHLLARHRGMTIGELLEEYAAKKYGLTAAAS